MRNGWLSAAAFAIPSLLLASAAQACVMHNPATLSTLPGLGLMGMHVGLVLPILAAFMERPLFTLAGAEESALCFSIQANLLSAVLNAAGMIGGFAMMGDGGFLWIFGSVLASAVVEHRWLQRQVGHDIGPGGFGTIFIGNVLSAIAIATLPFWREVLAPWSLKVSYFRHVQSYLWLIVPLTLGICGLVYAVAFWRTGITPARKREDRRRGFEVVMS